MAEDLNKLDWNHGSLFNVYNTCGDLLTEHVFLMEHVFMKERKLDGAYLALCNWWAAES
jgi:hypothetical protein